MNKFKIYHIVIYCLIAALWSDSRCMETFHAETTSPKFVPKTIADNLMFSTVRINTDIGTGTSFVFLFEPEGIEVGKNIPCLVTNRHVIVNEKSKANKAELIFHKKVINEDKPLNGEFIKLPINDNFHTHWIFHPNPNIDLCVLPFLKFFQGGADNYPFYKGINKQYIPSDERLNGLSAVEEIIMVGYPRGICDTVNNFPIFRRGITASHPAFDHNGKKEFVIDIASFPGSSGSLVGIYNNGGFTEGTNTFVGQERFIFLGVMHAGPQINVSGEVTGYIIPSFINMTSNTHMMMHLGYVIKSKLVQELEGELKKIL